MTKTGQIKVIIMAAAALALGLVAMLTASPAEAAFPGKNGKIAFQSNRDAGAGEIYTMKPDGTGVTRITFSGSSSDPAYSPDGSRIAFVSSGALGQDIFMMNADGTGRRQITNTRSADSEPAWSPDGTQIAFVANSSDEDGQLDPEIWAINADGTGRRQLTNNTFPDTQPAWSPQGDKIAFKSARTGDTNTNIYVMNSDGSGQTSITPNSPTGCSSNCYQGNDDYPAWSPDGSKIAYVHGYGPPENPFAGGGVPNIWTMDPNGANKTNVSNNPDTDATMPAWSPNGAKIAYVGATDTNRNIYVMNSNGTSQVPIADLRHDINPDWQQDSIPPQTTITSGPPALTRSTSASFGFASSETGSTFQCSLDGAPYTSCASPKSYSSLKNGRHTFRVRATDVAGNVDLTPATRIWTVDAIKPTVSGMSPRHTSIITDTTPAIKATVKDNLTNLQKANIKLYVNGTLISPTKYTYSAATDLLTYNSPKLSAGKKTIKVVATDRAGNVGARSWSFTIR